MSEKRTNAKRRDSKGRVLRSGETQRSDGMYMYRFNDAGGVRRTIYSWRLVETDKLPPNKRACEPLREIEKQLTRDTDDGIQSFVANKKTLNDFYEKYMSMKKELKPSTRFTYANTYDNWIRDELGYRPIGSIKYSDIKKFYLSLYFDKELKPNTIHAVNTILHPIFTLAVRDGYIRSNPAYQVYAELKKQNGWGQDKRHALTEQQQEVFVDFVRNSNVYHHWLSLFTFLLGTGCRIGEAIGLRWEDCDFQENIISINHSISYTEVEKGAGRRFYVSTPKTDAGTRYIPMFKEVKRALLDERLKQMQNGFCQQEIDGCSGFIFIGNRGTIHHPTNKQTIFQNGLKMLFAS